MSRSWITRCIALLGLLVLALACGPVRPHPGQRPMVTTQTTGTAPLAPAPITAPTPPPDSVTPTPSLGRPTLIFFDTFG